MIVRKHKKSISAHITGTINKIDRIVRQLMQENGVAPSPKKLSESIDLPLEKVR